MRFALVTVGFAFLCLYRLTLISDPMANPAAAILSRPRGNPAVLGNESVRPEALRPRLSASLPLERFDNPLRSGDKSSGLVAFSRHLIWRQVAVCREFKVMSYRVRSEREPLPRIG
jgi:hypothetical protein